MQQLHSLQTSCTTSHTTHLLNKVVLYDFLNCRLCASHGQVHTLCTSSTTSHPTHLLNKAVLYSFVNIILYAPPPQHRTRHIPQHLFSSIISSTATQDLHISLHHPKHRLNTYTLSISLTSHPTHLLNNTVLHAFLNFILYASLYHHILSISLISHTQHLFKITHSTSL